MVPWGDRSGAIIEPLLTDQWCRDCTTRQTGYRRRGKGRYNFRAQTIRKYLFLLMRDIQDWCISRQQWWGHRIPAFYDSDNNIYVAADESSARAKYQLRRR